ncbi:MAG: ABC transporter substrate-binding protein [Sumerlaeia bacterium]
MRVILGLAALLLLSIGMTGCGAESADTTRDGRVVITYWEKWEDFEKEAMGDLVDAYNASQDKVYVEYLSTGEIDRKLILATAGGNPPDVAGLWSWRLYTFAEMGALEPLDGLMQRDGLSPSHYLPIIMEQCQYKGFTWALPTTPATLALHYNREMFREAGLDPDRPPRTIAELNEYAKKLTRTDESGAITQLGFSPSEPGWWNDRWGLWFGGQLLDGDRIAIASPENQAAYDWVQSFPAEYGQTELQRFQAVGGQFASAQNLFISGQVAMVLQGVWMANFINKYNPELEWAVAPFPAVSADMAPVTVCECDVLVIPKGAKHREEAWDFIKFVQRQKNMEALCLGQRKFSPLAEVSESFYEEHPNPYIRVFRQLAESSNASYTPKTSIYSEYRDEINFTYDRIWRQLVEPSSGLGDVAGKIQPKLDKANRQWERIAEERKKEWAAQ